MPKLEKRKKRNDETTSELSAMSRGSKGSKGSAVTATARISYRKGDARDAEYDNLLGIDTRAHSVDRKVDRKLDKSAPKKDNGGEGNSKGASASASANKGTVAKKGAKKGSKPNPVIKLDAEGKEIIMKGSVTKVPEKRMFPPGTKIIISGNGHEYSEEEVTKMLEGYVLVPKSEWGNMASDSHIRYFRRTPEGDVRFGKSAFVTKVFERNEHKYLALKAAPGLHGRGGCFRFQLRLDNVDSIWKKLDRGANIELKMIASSIEKANDRITKLETVVTGLQQVIKTLLARQA
jgi:hypothetical protein